jgi:autotransporter translocation and assembly factor TamB
MQTIPVWVSQSEGDVEAKAIFSPDADVVLKKIPIDKLQGNLDAVCQSIGNTISNIKKVGSFKLKEVTIQVEVSAEGGVELIGTAKLGGKGAITLTFSA